MNRFEIVTPADLPAAVRLVAEPRHMALAGGVDTLDLLKQRIVAPHTLVDLSALKELQGIDLAPDGGLRLGALARLSEVAAHPGVRARFAALAEAAGEAATPQIRNLGTVGGNLLQRPRCWYFRNPDIVCLKKGGHICYAINGLNRYHAILGGGPSYIVHPSNLAPALIAFGASVRTAGSGGERKIVLDQFFALPSVDATRENVLQPGEIVVDVVVPAPAPSAHSAYLEVREKQSFDWPLVSVAAMLEIDPRAKKVHQANVVLGAVAPIPWRSREAERALAGAILDRAVASSAADAALGDARPLPHNTYKVAIARALVRRAILRAGRLEDV
jgi:xanthine dehydrogenase YagS FAD-binding subunit